MDRITNTTTTPGTGYNHANALANQNQPPPQQAPQRGLDPSLYAMMWMMQQMGMLSGQAKVNPMQAWETLLGLGQVARAAGAMQNPRLAGLAQAQQTYDMGKQMDAMGISRADRTAYDLWNQPGQLPAVAQRQSEADALRRRYVQQFGEYRPDATGTKTRQAPAWMNNLDDFRADQQQVILQEALAQRGAREAGVNFISGDELDKILNDPNAMR